MTPRPVCLAAIALVLSAAWPCGAQPALPDDRPKGYNLGPLGALAERIAPSERAAVGLTAAQTGLRVSAVEPGQPGATAGLAVGDAIVGVGNALFTDKLDPVYQLAAAIEPLYAATRPGKLVLRLWRGGKLVPLTVPIEGHGPKWADQLMEESFTYLLGQQDAAGSFPAPLGGQNGAVSVTSLCALAMMALDGAEGKHAEAIDRAIDYLLLSVGHEHERAPAQGNANWSQVNWNLGYGALALAEYAAQTQKKPEVKGVLAEVCQMIAKNQEENGGWSHGPGGPNALGYTDFAAVTNVVLAGYGAAGQVKIPLAPPVVAKATSYLMGTASGSGGIGYSQRRGQKGGGDPGRTAGSLLAFSLCDQRSHPFFGRMTSYFKQHMRDVPEGHASPVYHFGLGALGAYEVNLATEFLVVFKPEILMARRPDGSFYPRPSKESEAMRTSSDLSMGSCWTTGTYLLVWNLGRGKLSLLGKRGRR